MTSRRLRSPVLISLDRTPSVVLLAFALYAYSLWSFSNFLLSNPFDEFPMAFVGLSEIALQMVAGLWIWRLLRKGAILAAVVLSAKVSNVMDLVYFEAQIGASLSDVSALVPSIVAELVIGGLLLVTWQRMH